MQSNKIRKKTYLVVVAIAIKKLKRRTKRRVVVIKIVKTQMNRIKRARKRVVAIKTTKVLVKVIKKLKRRKIKKVQVHEIESYRYKIKNKYIYVQIKKEND